MPVSWNSSVALSALQILWLPSRQLNCRGGQLELHRAKTCSQTHVERITRLRKADRNFCDVLKAIDTSKLFVDTPDELNDIARWCNAEAHEQVQRETADMLKAYSNMS